ncbi:SRPBCC domain-containing protein [Halosquirtibacter laminarini]|uniref:SRPBCC domain-containing protein n=1 Tax=Halosquirtibacter laminarini TaxID=3374600 RepID=A0AC61NDM8_9BACT|nr:SRPBCC domain-containing protein [Prolixibacteraceae bacterium]
MTVINLRKKVVLEYPFKASLNSLYYALSNPSGLESWFADKVDGYDDYFMFYWEGDEQRAENVEVDPLVFIRWQWDTRESDEEFFEFRIVREEVGGGILLVVTDFVDADDEEDSILLLNEQVKTLKRMLGCS